MARAKKAKKKKLEELPGQDDPKAPLDGEVLLRESQAAVKALRKDLGAQARGSVAVTEALKARHAAEKDAKRTADGFAQWQERFIAQVAASWVLSCVFVRVLEDRGLLGRNRIAGQGAADSQAQFFQMAPSLTERDYLLLVFRELSRFPAARDLFDAKHNPVWLLGPSKEGWEQLLRVFRTPSIDAPALRFGQEDTRFVGDLYQDLDEDVRKRYALLQTPRFVESFILDRTLEPAIEKFGLDDTTVIDPTCGSGHFLLGSFERLFEHRLRAEPGLGERGAAVKALDAVFGADINAYAVAISRFRLTLAFLEKAGFGGIGEAPELPMHLVVADSLLHNPHVEQGHLADQEGASKAGWGDEFGLEDESAARDVLHRRYAAVVGNPPYITVKDKVLRDRYRGMYPRSAAGKYSVAAPFTERLFQLGRDGGRIGIITANSFMKREFGKKLILEYLPTVNLDAIVNTSGAYIPGHGTPTVLLFGSAEKPCGPEVLTVLASRGEPSTPEDPEHGEVWGSIAAHWSEVGFENDYISVTKTEREALAEHPWSLAGGGATELKALLEERASGTLGEVATSVGISCVTGEDDVYLMPPAAALRQRVGRTRPLVVGEHVRDWTLEAAGECVFPYSDELDVLDASELGDELRYLWPFRTNLSKRRRFGTPMLERGLTWYELQELYADKLRTPLTITFAFVATHNHFVLDRGGKIFKQTAPIIKLPETATEDDHLALLAYLNSSTACFWCRQVMANRGYGADSANARVMSAPWEDFYEFAGGLLKAMPLVDKEQAPLVALGTALDLLARKRMENANRSNVAGDDDTQAREIGFLGQMVLLQEELDWWVYEAFGLLTREQSAALQAERAKVLPWTNDLIDGTLDPTDLPQLCPVNRAFEVGLEGSPVGSPGALWNERKDRVELKTQPDGYRELALLRARVARKGPLRSLEQPEIKRRWSVINTREQAETRRADEILRNAESRLGERDHVMRSRDLVVLEESTDHDILFARESVPFLPAYRYSFSGMLVREEWKECWEAQRLEDKGQQVHIEVPTKYGSKNYQSASYYRLRGKLDVPKERFISYPGCESSLDNEPVYGWAGWNHLQRAKALGTLYMNRKTQEGWGADRLTPMLAGLLELLPWLHQWHSEHADYFQGFVDGQCSEYGLTHEDLRNWRPPERKKGSRKKTSKKKSTKKKEAAE